MFTLLNGEAAVNDLVDADVGSREARSSGALRCSAGIVRPGSPASTGWVPRREICDEPAVTFIDTISWCEAAAPHTCPSCAITKGL